LAGTSSNEGKGTFGLFVIAFLLGVGYVLWLTSRVPSGEPTATATETAISVTVGPTRTLRPTRTPEVVQTPEPHPSANPLLHQIKIGIVAGHWQSDSGAVCPDNLQEDRINLDVASRVVAILQYEGYDAELLPEFSEKLTGYRANAFVSIHADSCDVPEASGFKVARVAASAIPEEEDRLVECLIREYGKVTGLRFHRDSITFDMTEYHAFKEIHPQTPGAIIELGFMGADREILTEHSSRVAEGVVQGIVCFLDSR
jgi:N-acetylmuramoyl-L-alanine amidase